MENSQMIQVGDQYATRFSISTEDVKQFAAVTGDNNPVHLDDEHAKAAGFPKAIVHGFLGGSVFSKIFGTEFPGSGTIYLKQNLVFLQPMFPGDTYEAKVEIIEIIKEKHRAIVSTKVLNEQGQEVITGDATIIHKTKL